uniref:Uncharacterized protein n=1 Tax=Triticum urartu TaxID=4572 RepID=A0A8R7NY67_TRIUA
MNIISSNIIVSWKVRETRDLTGEYFPRLNQQGTRTEQPHPARSKKGALLPSRFERRVNDLQRNSWIKKQIKFEDFSYQ